MCGWRWRWDEKGRHLVERERVQVSPQFLSLARPGAWLVLLKAAGLEDSVNPTEKIPPQQGLRTRDSPSEPTTRWSPPCRSAPSSALNPAIKSASRPRPDFTPSTALRTHSQASARQPPPTLPRRHGTLEVAASSELLATIACSSLSWPFQPPIASIIAHCMLPYRALAFPRPFAIPFQTQAQ